MNNIDNDLLPNKGKIKEIDDIINGHNNHNKKNKLVDENEEKSTDKNEPINI